MGRWVAPIGCTSKCDAPIQTRTLASATFSIRTTGFSFHLLVCCFVFGVSLLCLVQSGFFFIFFFRVRLTDSTRFVSFSTSGSLGHRKRNSMYLKVELFSFTMVSILAVVHKPSCGPFENKGLTFCVAPIKLLSYCLSIFFFLDFPFLSTTHCSLGNHFCHKTKSTSMTPLLHTPNPQKPKQAQHFDEQSKG